MRKVSRQFDILFTKAEQGDSHPFNIMFVFLTYDVYTICTIYINNNNKYWKIQAKNKWNRHHTITASVGIK